MDLPEPAGFAADALPTPQNCSEKKTPLIPVQNKIDLCPNMEIINYRIVLPFMVMQTITPELGLEPRKLPDLNHPGTRKKLSGAAIEAVFKIAAKWDLTNEQTRELLGDVSNGRYYELKRTHKGVLTQDELTRVSLLIGIFKGLNILFSEKLANQWITRPNSNPMFHNSPPLTFLIEAGIPGMLAVRRLLDGRLG